MGLGVGWILLGIRLCSGISGGVPSGHATTVLGGVILLCFLVYLGNVLAITSIKEVLNYKTFSF